MSKQNSLSQLIHHAEPFLSLVRHRLDQIASGYRSDVFEPVRYALSLKGQLLRPFFVYASAHAFTESLTENDQAKLVHFAAAAELLHAASLAQDDVFDCEECRRGEQSLPKKHGNSAAILSGNLLYIEAFREMLSFGGTSQIEALLETAASMCEGELKQDAHAGSSLETPLYLDIITLKTARLTAMACRETARILNLSDNEIALMDELGETAGVLYQLYDDLQDNDVNVEGNTLMEDQKKRALNLLSKLPRSDLFASFVTVLTSK